MGYRDFDLLLDVEGDAFTSHVVRSPAGEAHHVFQRPFEPLVLENLLLRLGVGNRVKRSIDSDTKAAAKSLGHGLYEAAFGGEVDRRLSESLQEAEQNGERLRIRLRVRAPSLRDLPWEYLYDKRTNQFLALSKNTSLIRYLELPRAGRSLRVDGPIRIAVVISSPSDLPRLNAEREWNKLQEAFEMLPPDIITLEKVAPTLDALQERLVQDPVHVLHFVGHGVFESEADDGRLLFERENGRSHPVSSENLAAILHNHPSLRIAVLNCCEGARASTRDPFSGVAGALIQKGLPAVVAMQFAITDRAAIKFAEKFYESVAQGCTIDDALVEARVSMFVNEQDEQSFGAPVLFLRSDDGVLFDVPHRDTTRLPPPEEPWPVVQWAHDVARKIGIGLERLGAPFAPIYHRLLDTTNRSDYIVAALIGLLPLVASFPAHVFYSVKGFKGIGATHWSVIFVILLPLGLWVLRQVVRRLFCLGTAEECPIVRLLQPAHRATATAEIGIAAVRPNVFIVAALLAVMLNLVDAAEVLQHYVEHWSYETAIAPREPDWSVMFLADPKNVSASRNFVFIVIAYGVQTLAAFLGFLVFGLAFVHNRLYLRLVYQRHRRQDPAASILLNFDDPDRRFGQSDLHAVFDWQIVYLLIAGLGIVVSRYGNAKTNTAMFIDVVKTRNITGIVQKLFPDIGQVVLLICFSFCALCVLLPSFVKFLPYGKISKKLSSYLAEFVPPRSKHDPATITDDELEKRAEKFAENSFWPAGDSWAVWLFGAVFFVLATIIIPVSPTPLLAGAIWLIIVLLIAYLGTTFVFFGYRQALRIIDPRLVERKKK